MFVSFMLVVWVVGFMLNEADTRVKLIDPRFRYRLVTPVYIRLLLTTH